MTTVYVAMVCDRHRDPEPFLFATAEAAIDYARGQAARMAHDPDDVDESFTPGRVAVPRHLLRRGRQRLGDREGTGRVSTAAYRGEPA